MFVQGVSVPEALVPPGPERQTWPFTVPAVAQLLQEGLTFTKPVTFLVGDNGSGKSTLVEAFAERFGVDSRGGRAGVRTGRPDLTRTPLGEVLRLDTTVAGARMLGGPRKKKRGFFLRAETAFSMAENLGGVPGYWQEDTAQMSHGEGFITMFDAMMSDPGFYVLDEPESALSFTSCLQLVALMDELGRSGAQVVCATHSPILAATPHADIIELGEYGFRRTRWEELDLVNHWRQFLDRPGSYLRHLVQSTES